MFKINDNMSIYATRGDIVAFSVVATEGENNYIFKEGDVVRIKVVEKKDCESVVLQKDFAVTEEAESVNIFLGEADTRFGEVISKPTDYWYEVELNPNTNPQTILGYDEDGAKIFKLFPEGKDLEWNPTPEDLGTVDAELDITSERPIQNQAVAREINRLTEEVKQASMDAFKIKATIKEIVEYEIEPMLDEVAKEIVADTVTSVTASETNAKTYMNKSREYMDFAEDYSDLAKEYMEGAFATTPEGYAEVVEKVKYMDIKTSNESPLLHSKEGRLRVVEIVGNSEQKTLSGKNKFSANWVQGTIGSTNGTQQESTECVCTDDFISVEPNVLYTLSRDIYTGRVQVRGYDADGNFVGKGETVLELIKGSTADNPMTNQASCVVKFKDGVYKIKLNDFSNNVNTKYQLEEGSLVTDYEEYCGGVASPNPYYPQEIESVGDCIELIRGVYNSTTGEYTGDYRYVASKVPIPCKSGDVVKVNHDALGCVIVYYNENGYLSVESKHHTTEVEFIVPDGATCFNINFSYGETITLEEVGKITLTVNGKYIVPITTRGKNLIPYPYLHNTRTYGGTTITDEGDGRLTVSGTATATHYFSVRGAFTLPKGKYKLSGCPSGGDGTKYCTLLRKDGNNADRTAVDYGSGAVFEVTDETTEYVIIICIYTGVNVSNLTFKPMLCKCDANGNAYGGDDYEVWTEVTEHIYLDEPLRKVGTVADRIVQQNGIWGVERKIGEFVYDGSSDENWYVNSSIANIFYTTLETGRLANSEVLCSHYNYVTSVWADFDYGLKAQNYISIKNIDVSTSEEFKALLSAEPITVDYILATPTFTPLDTASQKALNNLKTFDGVTYIDFDTTIQPSAFEVKYGSSDVGAGVLENEDRIKNIEIGLSDIPIPLLLTEWVESNGTFTQTVAVNGVSGDTTPSIQISPVGDIATDDELNSFACISGVKTIDGAIVFIATEKPSISFTVVAKCLLASGSSAVVDVTKVVGRVSELETEVDKLNSDLQTTNSNMHKWIYYDSGYEVGKNYDTPPQCNEILVVLEYGNGGATFTTTIPYAKLDDNVAKPFMHSSYYNANDTKYGFVSMNKKNFNIAMLSNGVTFADGIITMYYR